MVLVGMKSDLCEKDPSRRHVSTEEAHALAISWGVPFFQINLQKFINVNECFEQLVCCFPTLD